MPENKKQNSRRFFLKSLSIALPAIGGSLSASLALEKDQGVHDIDVAQVQKDLRENPLANRKVPAKYSRILPFKG